MIKGVGQIFFLDNTAAGVLVLVGMFFCSPISACMALYGSVLGSITGLVPVVIAMQLSS